MKIYASKNYFHITVKEICEIADIHRTTFYLHFENIDAVLKEIEDEILAQISEQSKNTDYIVPITDEASKAKFDQTVWHVLDYMHSQKEYLIPLMDPYGNLHFINSYKKVIFSETKKALQKNHCTYGDNEDHIIRYMASGIVEILYYWLKNDDMDVAQITKIILSFNSINAFIKKSE